ncbi:TldD/PmbA family protein [Neobacillus piezotolerans]|uniref:TldD/PmbA family protein n=1 Tax=Neobacillus piezotolerans TaxID=2259171 RepID=A0A3D8GNQ5_9BACI|nr:TldD/PmbA family protein [Neobacillus piezotolerans]RDU36058.1 TldD/PmbA family protein [Neobacillus piezotolerans]
MLSKHVIEDVLAAALTTGGDFSEIFIEDRFTNNLTLQSGKIETALSGRDFGVGIRVFKGLRSIYAYTTDSSREGLLKAAANAAQAIKGETAARLAPFVSQAAYSIHPIQIMPRDVGKSRKAEMLHNAFGMTKNYHSSISQVTVRYMDEEQNVLIANSEGTFTEDKRVRSRLAIQAVAVRGNQMELGFYGPGAHQGFEFFENLNLGHYTSEAARIAVTKLDAIPCPSGKFPVIIDNEFGGVIFHEACGHGLEATAVAKDTSVFANRIGERVAPEIVSYIDDGTLQNEWGSINIDDEGEKARKNILIENGILKGYLIDKFNGRRMGMASTGSGRRESFRFAPTSRMTNTYIAPGNSSPEEILSNTEHGIYAKYMGGGQVNPATGDYNFAVLEAFEVKNGKLGRPLKGATLIGNGPKTLQMVDMVGNNLSHGAGMCGSQSGSIPVNVGQPTIRVSEITVGGTKGE